MADRQQSGPAPGQEYTGIVYETGEGIAKITISRPEVRNVFRPAALFELSSVFNTARDDPDTGVIILTGAGTQAFCPGGDQKIRGDDGYVDARQAREMGLVNAVLPLDRLEEETVSRARERPARSPLAPRMLKGALNAVTDGAAGMQQFAGDATLLYYMREEAQEGRDAFRDKRSQDSARCPERP